MILITPIILATMISCNQTKENVVEEETKDTSVTDESLFKYSVDIPKSEIKKLDDIINNEISKFKKGFEESQDSGEVSFKTIEKYKDDKIISYLLQIDQWGSNMPHPNLSFISFNYSIESNKLISFNDYFRLDNKSDSLYLIQQIKDNLDIDVDALLLGDESLLKYPAFNIQENSVQFNYGDYGITSYNDGCQTVKIDKKKLTKVIRN